MDSWVYVKLQPYRQSSVSGAKFHKLAKRFYGPFRVIERMGPVAYKLDLPSGAKIHNVFHCSVLKAHVGSPPTTIDQLPPDSYANNLLVIPLTILRFKTSMVNGVPTRFALVQWQGLSPDNTSWEEWSTLQSIYNLEDKVVADGDGNVTCEGPIIEAEGSSTAAVAIDETRPKRVIHKAKGIPGFIYY